jgi:hypothetical protein
MRVTLPGDSHFEYAVAVNKEKADVLTTFEFIEEILNKM